MKIISNVITVIVGIVLGVMLAVILLDVVPNYKNAKEFSELSNWDKVEMYETDNAHFWELKNSYKIIENIPLIRGTL